MRSKKDAIYAFVIITLIPVILAGGLVLLGYWGLLEPQTIVLVVIPEVAIAIIFYYFLGERRRNKMEELLDLSEASEKFSHLDIIMVEVIRSAVSYGYVENKLTKKVYQVPHYLAGAIESGVIPIVAELKSVEELEELIKKKGFTLVDRKPTFYELKSTQQ